MVRIQIVGKCKSRLRVNSLFQSTLASVTSLSNRFCSIFKVKPSNSENSNQYPGFFGFEELKDLKGLDLLLKESVRKAENILHEIQKKNQNLNPAIVFDEILDLYRVKRLAEFVMLIHPEKEFAEAAKQVYIKANQCIDKLYSDTKFRAIYDFFLDAIQDKHSMFEKEPINRYFIRMLLHSFKRGELILDEETTSLFAKPESHPFKIRRRKWWQLFKDIPPDEWFTMLNKRLKFASRHHYDTYANFVLEHTIAREPYFVLMFLENLKKKLKPKVNEDLSKIREESLEINLQSRDISHLIAKSKEKILDIDSCIKDYFSLDTCMDGLKSILRSLYDIILEVVDDKDIINGELWHEDVKKYCVRDGNEILGYIYCDLFARPCKSSTNNTFLIQSGKMWGNGMYQTPIVIISLSFLNPGISQSPLLNPSDVCALFCGMGHAIHCIFGQTKYQLIHGTSSDYDLSKIASYLMLYFVSDPKVLHKFAKHYQTGELIPDDLIEKLLSYIKKFSAYNLQMMVFNAAFDQACHSHLFPYFSFSEIFKQVWKQHFGSSRKLTIDEKDTYCRLIYKRRALDCSYLMSNAVAALIWHKYFKDDPLSQLAGKRYRNEFLAQSGLKPARVIVEKYLKINLTPEYLSNALLKNI